MSALFRREVLRASVTRRLAHGDRLVVTRVYLSDGTVQERTNPGVPDDDDLLWSPAGNYRDLDAERQRPSRDGWSIEEDKG